MDISRETSDVTTKPTCYDLTNMFFMDEGMDPTQVLTCGCMDVCNCANTVYASHVYVHVYVYACVYLHV